MTNHTNIEPGSSELLDRSESTVPFQTASREEIEAIADRLISENLEAFRVLATHE